MTTIADLLARAPVLPVLVIEQEADAVPLARALVAGGIPVLEVTLRSAAALAAISAIAREVPEAVVGAGTVIDRAGYRAAVAAGARFVVSPGCTESLLAEGAVSGAPLLPGVATASDMLRALEAGHDHVKFFPAEAAGGVAALRAFSGPFPQLRFCPTGGVGPDNLQAYLALDAVVTVGGSWLTPRDYLAARDWAGITRLARDAVALVEGARR